MLSTGLNIQKLTIMHIEKLKNLFIKKHGTPNNETKLNEYLEYLMSYQLPNENMYTEKHHILDRASFPEYTKCSWNIVELLYEHHVYVHELLFEAYNIRRYQRTLNFKNIKKEKVLISNAAKNGWISLKNNNDRYNKWLEKKITYLKSLPSSHYSNMAKKYWDNISDEERRIHSEKIKKSKTPEVKKKRKRFFERIL